MENEGVLDPSNEVHLAALHYVFLPIINRHLLLFSEGHNRAPISSEQNQSPEKLWVRGMLSNPSNRIADKFLNQVTHLCTHYLPLHLLKFTFCFVQ